MMYTNLVVWGILLAIGVSDARGHRIPNKLLILLFVSLCLNTLVQTPHQALWSVLLNEFTAFVIALAFALVLHFARVMAPGDVKFIAVLGFYLGTNELLHYLYCVCLMTAFIGSMYWLMNRLHLALKTGVNMEVKEQANHINLTGMVVSMHLKQQTLKKKILTGNDMTYMPFAPILVIGLALHRYYA